MTTVLLISTSNDANAENWTASISGNGAHFNEEAQQKYEYTVSGEINFLADDGSLSSSGTKDASGSGSGTISYTNLFEGCETTATVTLSFSIIGSFYLINEEVSEYSVGITTSPESVAIETPCGVQDVLTIPFWYASLPNQVGYTNEMVKNGPGEDYFIVNTTVLGVGTMPDSDNDGTADNVDACPNDPNKIEPGSAGCGVVEPVDSDNDGVYDNVDACPDEYGTQSDGCPAPAPIGTQITLDEVTVCYTNYNPSCDPTFQVGRYLTVIAHLTDENGGNVNANSVKIQIGAKNDASPYYNTWGPSNGGEFQMHNIQLERTGINVLVLTFDGDDKYSPSSITREFFVEGGGSMLIDTINLGYEKLKKGLPDHALVYFDTALGISPHDLDALFGKAAALYNLGRFSDEIKVLNIILEIDPGDVLALLEKAIAYEALGQYETAYDLAYDAYGIDPTYPGVIEFIDYLEQPEISDTTSTSEETETTAPPDIPITDMPSGTFKLQYYMTGSDGIPQGNLWGPIEVIISGSTIYSNEVNISGSVLSDGKHSFRWICPAANTGTNDATWEGYAESSTKINGFGYCDEWPNSKRMKWTLEKIGTSTQTIPIQPDEFQFKIQLDYSTKISQVMLTNIEFTVEKISGTAKPVQLQVTDWSSKGLQGTLSSTSITPTERVTLTVRPSCDTPEGFYDFTVKGTSSGGESSQGKVTVQVWHQVSPSCDKDTEPELEFDKGDISESNFDKDLERCSFLIKMNLLSNARTCFESMDTKYNDARIDAGLGESYLDSQSLPELKRALYNLEQEYYFSSSDKETINSVIDKLKNRIDELESGQRVPSNQLNTPSSESELDFTPPIIVKVPIKESSYTESELESMRQKHQLDTATQTAGKIQVVRHDPETGYVTKIFILKPGMKLQPGDELTEAGWTWRTGKDGTGASAFMLNGITYHMSPGSKVFIKSDGTVRNENWIDLLEGQIHYYKVVSDCYQKRIPLNVCGGVSTGKSRNWVPEGTEFIINVNPDSGLVTAHLIDGKLKMIDTVSNEIIFLDAGQSLHITDDGSANITPLNENKWNLLIDEFELNAGDEFSQNTLYKNDEYRFSFEYPDDWYISNENQGLETWTSLVDVHPVPEPPDIDTNFNVSFFPEETDDELGGLSGQEYLDGLIELLEEGCINGTNCSDFKVIDSHILFENGKYSYFVANSYTFTKNEGDIPILDITIDREDNDSNTLTVWATIRDDQKELYTGDLINAFLSFETSSHMQSFELSLMAIEHLENFSGITQEIEDATIEDNSPTPIIDEPPSEGGGCLIATATYGSELAPQIQQLRELRDNSILQTESGSAFINSFNDFYYSFSPIIADYERENPIFKEMVKIAITPMISSLSILNYVDMDSEAEVLGYGISLILLNIGMYFGIPVAVIVGIRRI